MTNVTHVYTLIRRPPEDVLEAFVDPATLRRFWLKDASGRLSKDKWETWEFMVPGVTAPTRLKVYEPGRRLVIEWPEDETAEIVVKSRPDGSTRIDVRSAVSGKTVQEVVSRINDTTYGYSIVLCNLKALLETGRSANLVEDQAKLIVEDGKPES